MEILFLIGHPPEAAVGEWKEIEEYRKLGYFTPSKEIYLLVKALEQNNEFEQLIKAARKDIGFDENGISWKEYVNKYMPGSKRKLTESERKDFIAIFSKVAKKIFEIRQSMNLDYFVDIQLPYLIYGNFVYFEPPIYWYSHSPVDQDGERIKEEYIYSIKIQINNRTTKNELINYIKNNWKDISYDIHGLAPRAEFYISLRDQRIVALRDKEKLTFKKIAEKIVEEFDLNDIEAQVNEDSVKTAYRRAKNKITFLTKSGEQRVY